MATGTTDRPWAEAPPPETVKSTLLVNGQARTLIWTSGPACWMDCASG
jgi:hypothetical protein